MEDVTKLLINTTRPSRSWMSSAIEGTLSPAALPLGRWIGKRSGTHLDCSLGAHRATADLKLISSTRSSKARRGGSQACARRRVRVANKLMYLDGMKQILHPRRPNMLRHGRSVSLPSITFNRRRSSPKNIPTQAATESAHEPKCGSSYTCRRKSSWQP